MALGAPARHRRARRQAAGSAAWSAPPATSPRSRSATGNCNRRRHEVVAAQRYALALEAINENLYDWDIDNDTVYYAPGLYKILGIAPEQMRSPKDWTDRVHPDDQPLFKYTLGRASEGQHAALLDGVALSRWRRQLALGAAGRHRGARPRRPRAAHGRRRRRHHRGQARRRGDDRLGRSAEGDEPFDLRAADRARYAGDLGDAAVRRRRRADLPARERPLPAGGAARPQPRAKTRSCAAGRSRRAALRWSAAPRWKAASSIFPTCRPITNYHWPEASQGRQLPRHAWRAAVARGRADRRHDADPRGAAAVQRQADRADLDLCRPGRDRDRDGAAVQRGAGAHRRDRAHALHPRHHDRQHGRRPRADDADARWRCALRLRQPAHDGVPALSGRCRVPGLHDERRAPLPDRARRLRPGRRRRGQGQASWSII